MAGQYYSEGAYEAPMMQQREAGYGFPEVVAYGSLLAAMCFGVVAYNNSAATQLYAAPAMVGRATNVAPAAIWQGRSVARTQDTAMQAVREVQRPLSLDTLSSRVDRPIFIPSGVSVTHANGVVTVKGPHGTLEREVPVHVSLEEENSILLVTFDPAERNAKAMFGLYRALIANMVTGVSQKFTKNMEMIGVGYRARVEGKDLVLLVGKSHDVIMPIPEGLEVTVTDNTKIQVTGINNEVVGQFCANIRKERPPEPYKGKGIRFAGETVLIKDGKK